jgi:sulfatase maturation enzyme AslB (radical SAM superfamily)
MCPRVEMERDVGYMSLDLVKKISSELGELGIATMNLHMFGESILHPKLRQILEILKSDNPDVWLSFSTNATFLKNKRFDRFLGVLDNLFISIDGMNAATYQKHRINGDFEKVLKNVSDFLEYRKQKGQEKPRIEIRMVDLDQVNHEKQSFLSNWNEQLFPNDSVSIKPVDSFGGSVGDLAHLRKTSCSFLSTIAAIMWNGDLTTCCYDVHGNNVMGNVRDASIREIFESAAYEDLRRRYESGILQSDKNLLCHTCLEENYLSVSE